MRKTTLYMANSYQHKMLKIFILCITTIAFMGCKVYVNSINADTESGKSIYL